MSGKPDVAASAPDREPGGAASPARTLVLGIETATPWGGAALMNGAGRLLGHVWGHARTGYSRRLMPTIDLLLREASAEPADLAAIAVSEGPGSFTGVRIGLVTAKTLAQTLGIPLYTCSTLEAAALRWPMEGDPIAVLLDARRGEIYSGVYRRLPGDELQTLRPARAERAEVLVESLRAMEAPTFWLAGDAVEKTRPAWEGALAGRARVASMPWSLPAADTVARLGLKALCTHAPSADPLRASPAYLRASDAERGLAP